MPTPTKRILALEPYYGGSHQRFLEGWIKRSQHAWSLLTLPAYKWKWRMRHAAITFAERVAQLNTNECDILFTSDMLNLAEFAGLAPAAVANLPCVIYFHENQLTYPQRHTSERDYHYAFTNLTSALAADQVWFNSDFHRSEYLQASRGFLRRMPDFRPLAAIDRIAAKSSVQPPGVDAFPYTVNRRGGPLRILWAARWEHDKNPADFFSAIRLLRSSGIDFRLLVLGQQFDDSPRVFADAKLEFAEQIEHWGFVEDRHAYQQLMASADVIVSTAMHEFFGISVVEAIACGVYPLLPDRLVYPELLSRLAIDATERFLYDGSVPQLADRLRQLSSRLQEDGSVWASDARLQQSCQDLLWERRARSLDEAIADAA